MPAGYARNVTKVEMTMADNQSGKVALMTGIARKHGPCLAELLLEKGYEVHCINRRSTLFNTQRLDHINADPLLTGILDPTSKPYAIAKIGG